MVFSSILRVSYPSLQPLPSCLPLLSFYLILPPYYSPFLLLITCILSPAQDLSFFSHQWSLSSSLNLQVLQIRHSDLEIWCYGPHVSKNTWHVSPWVWVVSRSCLVCFQVPAVGPKIRFYLQLHKISSCNVYHFHYLLISWWTSRLWWTARMWTVHPWTRMSMCLCGGKQGPLAMCPRVV